MKILWTDRIVVKTVTAIILLCMFDSLAQGQAYPNKSIRLITPVAPGGTSDLLARLIGAKLTESLKQQVIIDNRASASGVNAAEIAAKSLPDGYTLFCPYHQHTVNAALGMKLPYHPVNDFTPITQLTSAGLMLVVNPSSPVKTLKEFAEWTRNSKGTFNFGSAGLGSGGHLAGELYNLMAGIKSQHIPYKGSGPSMIDLIAGQYQYSFVGIQGAQTQVRSGKLRGLAVTNAKRVKALPDLPAVAEIFPGFEVVGWFGVAGPAGLPEAILARLHDEIVKILQLADVRDRIVGDGAEPIGSTPQEFRKYMLGDMIRWGKFVRESGAKFE